MNSPARDPAAFTLLELAVVLTILGLLFVLVAPMVFDSIQRTRTTRARQELEALRNEVLGYVALHHALPGRDAPPVRVKDPWDNWYIYVPAPGLVPAGAQTGLPICSAPAEEELARADLQISTGPESTGGETITRVAFLLASQGPSQDPDNHYQQANPILLKEGPRRDDMALYVTFYQLLHLACSGP